jgi:hypothetical protein
MHDPWDDAFYVIFEGDRPIKDWRKSPFGAGEALKEKAGWAKNGWRWEEHKRAAAAAFFGPDQWAECKHIPPDPVRPWTDEDDRFLLSYGWCMGVEYVADHDLERDGEDAKRRVAWLRKNNPKLYAELWRR